MTGVPLVKHKVVALLPGFYAIRYICEAVNAPVAILQSVASDDHGAIEMIGARNRDSVMLAPDAPLALVRVINAKANLTISLLLPEEKVAFDVVFDVERIPEQPPKKQAHSSSLVFLEGHVEWKGDIKVLPGRLLGGMKSSARIEGFSIKWLKNNHNTTIRYGCTFGPRDETSTASNGGFVGSRHQSAPIKSLWIELVGADADQYNLQYTAVFSRSGKVLGRQAEVVSGSASGDYLVGLWVSVEDARLASSIYPPDTLRRIRELKTFKA